MGRKPYAFFYGGYMDPELLRAAGISPENSEAGYVEGFRLTIGPLANLEEESGAKAYGLLARLSHADLDTLYGGDPAHLKGAIYLPEAVLVHTMDGRTEPALTYICAALSGDKADPAYVANLAAAAEAIGLPADYVSSIRRLGD